MITASLLEISEIESSVIFISSTVKGNEMANLGNYQAAVDLFTQAINLDAKDFRLVHCPIASVHYTNNTNLVQILGWGGNLLVLAPSGKATFRIALCHHMKQEGFKTHKGKWASANFDP